MSMKNPLTLSGIEPATFRFVAQHLNHCATAVPSSISKSVNVRVMVMLRRVRVAILAVENNKYYIFRVCVCSLRYPACNALCAMLLSVAWPAVQYFPTLFHKLHGVRAI